MAGIVAVTRFCEAGSEAFASYINYIDRNNATKKDNLEKYNLFNEYLGYMDNDTKTIIGDYEGGTQKVSALFTRNKDSVNESEKGEIKEIFQTAQRNGSNMWQTVISFENEYLEEVGIYDSKSETLNEKLLISAGRKAINTMLEKEGLENAMWTAAFHYNTDNIHIHIATVEPTPMREQRIYRKWEKDKNGNYKKDNDGNRIPVINPISKEQETYKAFKGTFKQSSIEALKSSLRSELEHNKDTYTDLTKALREIVDSKKEKPLMRNNDFEEKMLMLYKEIKKSGTNRRYWNYNQNTLANLKPQIDDLSDLFIKSYHLDDFNDLLDKMEKEAIRQTNAYGGNINDYINNQLYDRNGGLYTRLGNAILKELRAYDKERSNQLVSVKEAEKLLITGNDKEIQEAIDRLRELSDRGNTFAQNKLGILYLKGEYVEKDNTKAVEYFKKAASNGNTFAEKMVKSFSAVTNRDTANYRSFCKRDFYKALRMMERTLKYNYEKARNLSEAEELQREIDNRGEEVL